MRNLVTNAIRRGTRRDRLWCRDRSGPRFRWQPGRHHSVGAHSGSSSPTDSSAPTRWGMGWTRAGARGVELQGRSGSRRPPRWRRVRLRALTDRRQRAPASGRRRPRPGSQDAIGMRPPWTAGGPTPRRPGSPWDRVGGRARTRRHLRPGSRSKSCAPRWKATRTTRCGSGGHRARPPGRRGGSADQGPHRPNKTVRASRPRLWAIGESRPRAAHPAAEIDPS